MTTKSFRNGRAITLSRKTEKIDGTTVQVSVNNNINWTDSVTGVENPRWRAQVAAGVQAGTQLSANERIVNKGNMFLEERYVWPPLPKPDGTWVNYKSTFGGYALAYDGINNGPQPSESLANNLALVEFVSKCRRRQTAVTGGVILGELGQTLRMLKSPLGTLRHGLTNYLSALKKRGKVKGKPSAIKKRRKEILAETWLEYSFGWIPAANDIADILTALNSEEREQRQTVSAFSVTSTSVHGSESFNAGSPPTLVVSTKTSRTCKVKYYGALTLSQPHKGSHRQLGFDLSNFAPTAWELLPWSFLVDYFTNIGDIVSAASFARHDLRWVMKTVIKEYRKLPSNYSMKMDTSSAATVVQTAFSPGRAATTYRTVFRDPYTGSLIPSIEFNIPGFSKKWLNMLALSRQSRKLTPYY